MLLMFYHPGNSETFQEWSYGSWARQGALMYCLWQTTRPQCQSNKAKGRESREESCSENLQDAGYKQVAERWRKRHKENKQQDTGMNGIYFTAWHEEFKELRRSFFVSQLSRNIQALIITRLVDGT